MGNKQTSAWYDLPCSICGKPIRIHRDWENPPKAHKECREVQVIERIDPSAVILPRVRKKREAKTEIALSPSKQVFRIFLCHSSTDKARVRDLYERLKADNFAPWLDEQDLLPGQDWNLEITRAVRASHVVIVCLSPTAVAKTGYIQKEIRVALDVADEQPEGCIFLIPAKFEAYETPERLRRWHWVELFDPTGYAKLVSALRTRAQIVTP
jgi:TIR domain